jgi:hypothetical protein
VRWLDTAVNFARLYSPDAVIGSKSKAASSHRTPKGKGLEMFGARFFNTAGVNINEALPLWKIRDA